MHNTRPHYYPLATLLLSILTVAPLSSFAQNTATATSATTSTPTTTETAILPPPIIDTRQPLLQPIAQTRITNLAANMSNRYDASSRRLDNVSMRLESRINKMSAEGFEVSAAKTALTEAVTRLNAGKLNLATIDVEVGTFVGASDPHAAWVRLETIYSTIQEHIVAAHTSLRECVRLLETASLLTPLPEAPQTSTSTYPE